MVCVFIDRPTVLVFNRSTDEFETTHSFYWFIIKFNFTKRRYCLFFSTYVFCLFSQMKTLRSRLIVLHTCKRFQKPMYTKRNRCTRKAELAVAIKIVSRCFKPSQPQRMTSGLRETFIKRYAVERTSKAEIRPEEQSEKAESCRENLWNEIQLKGL